ncbi:DUF3080 domain-containing protein [Grimontia kaedaensis]|uniref:DUF3080 domain-containing protein n=1 Tax=Grimontia kaedaensis TaxID=2872157 RepID=A0ABY4WY97_9GAMM|nr:DUF3080 family protein [Grimontia kaedaensis]USH03943.1 DUF3080 domain-containing protein [Grimontia kaedaensis]
MVNRIAVIIIALFLLSGCLEPDKARAQFENYQTRLANVVNTEPLPLEESDYIELPRKRDLKLPVGDVRMGLLDAYELRECGLFQLIADRNSILGKVQDAFRQLNYEVSLLNTLELCLADVESDALREQLLNAQKQKQQQLSTVYWNTLVSSDAWRQQLTPASVSLIAPDKPFPHSEALLAINAYANLYERGTDIVSLQEPIEKQRYLGSVFHSMDESTRWLNTITKQLYRDDLLVICGANRDPTRLNYLRNVFDKFFIGEVQPYLSKINGLYLDAQPALETLHRQLPENDVFLSYNDAYFAGSHYQSFQKAVKDHVGYWQQLFQRCNVQL